MVRAKYIIIIRIISKDILWAAPCTRLLTSWRLDKTSGTREENCLLNKNKNTNAEQTHSVSGFFQDPSLRGYMTACKHSQKTLKFNFYRYPETPFDDSKLVICFVKYIFLGKKFVFPGAILTHDLRVSSRHFRPLSYRNSFERAWSMMVFSQLDAETNNDFLTKQAKHLTLDDVDVFVSSLNQLVLLWFFSLLSMRISRRCSIIFSGVPAMTEYLKHYKVVVTLVLDGMEFLWPL